MSDLGVSAESRMTGAGLYGVQGRGRLGGEMRRGSESTDNNTKLAAQSKGQQMTAEDFKQANSEVQSTITRRTKEAKEVNDAFNAYRSQDPSRYTDFGKLQMEEYNPAIARRAEQRNNASLGNQVTGNNPHSTSSYMGAVQAAMYGQT